MTLNGTFSSSLKILHYEKKEVSTITKVEWISFSTLGLRMADRFSMWENKNEAEKWRDLDVGDEKDIK